MKITKTLKVDLDQADVEQAIKEYIQKTDPSITVEAIEFTQRRNPTRLDVEVKAYYGDVHTEPTKPVVVEEEENVEEETEQVPTTSEEDIFQPEENNETEEEPVEAEEGDEPHSIAEIFGGM